MKGIRIAGEAESELRSAIVRYEGERGGLGRRLWDEVQAGLIRISEYPAIGSLFQGGRFRLPIRTFSLPRFPYSIVYREVDDIVEVIAIAHESRRTGYWRRRAR